jgi:hypothetical protein
MLPLGPGLLGERQAGSHSALDVVKRGTGAAASCWPPRRRSSPVFPLVGQPSSATPVASHLQPPLTECNPSRAGQSSLRTIPELASYLRIPVPSTRIVIVPSPLSVIFCLLENGGDLRDRLVGVGVGKRGRRTNLLYEVRDLIRALRSRARGTSAVRVCGNVA